jgi:hypothetical protein
VLVGDFRLSPGVARHEAGPSVPRGRVLVTIDDLFPQGPSRYWRTVTSLGMPRALIVTGRWWSVRYARRALSIKVTIGSAATDTLVHQVQRLLRGLQRVR